MFLKIHQIRIDRVLYNNNVRERTDRENGLNGPEDKQLLFQMFGFLVFGNLKMQNYSLANIEFEGFFLSPFLN